MRDFVMIYLDNIIFSLQRHGGVSVLWGNLIEHLLENRNDAIFLDFGDAELNKIRNSLAIPANRLIKNNSFPILLERYRDVKISEKYPIIFHSSYYRISNQKNVKNVTTVHDFTYEKFFSGIAKKIHIWQKYRAIRNSESIICISESTKSDLMRYLPEISENKIRVIYNGVSEEYHLLSKELPLYSDYVLFVGGRQAYKNFEFAVSCVKECKKKLLVVGSSLSNEERGLVTNILGKDGYEEIVHPTNAFLNQIYNSVYCLLYPSLYEGFGIPVIEAQKAGCPVIAMNCSSIPEIIGECPLLLNSSSCSEFIEKLQMLDGNRNEFVQAGIENSKRFSWNKMTEQYVNLYEELGYYDN